MKPLKEGTTVHPADTFITGREERDSAFAPKDFLTPTLSQGEREQEVTPPDGETEKPSPSGRGQSEGETSEKGD